MVWLSIWLKPQLGTIFGQLRFDDNNGWSQSPAGPQCTRSHSTTFFHPWPARTHPHHGFIYFSMNLSSLFMLPSTVLATTKSSSCVPYCCRPQLPPAPCLCRCLVHPVAAVTSSVSSASPRAPHASQCRCCRRPVCLVAVDRKSVV